MSEATNRDGDRVVVCWSCGWARVARDPTAAIRIRRTHQCPGQRVDVVTHAEVAELRSNAASAPEGDADE